MPTYEYRCSQCGLIFEQTEGVFPLLHPPCPRSLEPQNECYGEGNMQVSLTASTRVGLYGKGGGLDDA